MKYLILAGGSGTRLWPLSRKKLPKQFLNLTEDDKSMLQMTAERVTNNLGEDIFVISNESSKKLIIKQLKNNFKKFKTSNFIPEPIGRNTAPAIAYSSLFFNPDDVIAVLSSDHFVKNSFKFNSILNSAEKIAKKNFIVTLGIKPDYPSTGYGYIKKNKNKLDNGFMVDKFVEKPNEKTALKYIKDGSYFWNAGIFIFKVSFFQEELKKYSPELFSALEDIKIKIKKKKKITKDDFLKFKNISIDYALMEKSDKIVVIPSDIGWNDIGGFQSLYDILEKDENKNIQKSALPNIINIETKNSLIINNSKKKIALIGCSDLCIINTDDAILISALNKTEKVKDVVEILKKTDEPEL